MLLYGSLIFAALAIGLCKVIGIVDGIYDTRYRRELYLLKREERKAAEDRRELLDSLKNPKWESVEDEADDNPPSDEEEGGA